MRKVLILDDTYALREPRCYYQYCPALRSERNGFKVVEERYDDKPSNRVGEHSADGQLE